MKTIDEQDHYEVLELPRGARKEDVERAYPLVRGAYESRSLALYSIYDDSASEAIRERIDLAYQVLSDDDARRRYDESLGLEAPSAPAPEPRKRRLALPPLLQGAVQRPLKGPVAEETERRGTGELTSSPLPERAAARPAAPPPAAAPASEAHAAGTLEAIEAIEDEASHDYSGARLRRIRLGAGLEVDDISKVTKIAPRHLEAIEEERFVDLPADVYVRGFVASYARTLGLDANAVAHSFMQRRAEAGPSEPPRGLFTR